MTSVGSQSRTASEEVLTTVNWPAERFYWALIHGSTAGVLANRGGRQLDHLPEGLLDEIQGRLPEPLEYLHAVAIPWQTDAREQTRTGLLVCAARIDDLRTVPTTVRVVAPAAVPDCVHLPGVPIADRLNLLVGPFEPPAFRRRRRLRHAVAAVWLVALSSLILIGLHRRAEAHDQRVASARAGVAMLLADTPARSADELASLVERTVRTLDQAQRVPASLDATAGLAAILGAWPNLGDEEDEPQDFVGPPDSTPSSPPARVEVQSLFIQHARASISAIVSGGTKDDRGTLAERLLGSFQAPTGWSLEEPRWTHQQSLTRLSFTLGRAEPRSTAAAGSDLATLQPLARAGSTERDQGVRP